MNGDAVRSATSMSRRQFLVAAGAGLVLAGCGSSGDTDAGTDAAGGDGGAGGGAGSAEGLAAPEVVALFSPDRVIAAGMPQRVPFALVDNGVPVVGDGEEALVTVLRDGTQVDQQRLPGRVVGHSHPEGEEHDDGHVHRDLRRYYALRTTLPEPGIYELSIDLGGGMTPTLAVQAFDPDEVSVLLPGATFPAVVTPTVDDHAGVEPICTRDPQCDFHDRSASRIVGAGEPMAVLVATPAYCQTTFCGPVLDVLIEAAPAHPDIAFVHAEVWANPEAVGGDISDPGIRPAPALAELGLTYEPALFFVDGSGTIADRIDNLFDRQELEASLAQIATT